MDTPQATPATISAAARQSSAVKHRQRNQRERWIMVATVVIIVAAWLVGYFNTGSDAFSRAGEVLPGATTIDRSGELFIGRDAAGDLVGYAGVGRATGYGGPMEVIVGVDLTGNILGVAMVEERKSPGFFRLVRNSKLFESFSASQITDPLQLGEDLDSISGATMSAEGVANGVRTAIRAIATDALQTPLPPPNEQIEIGLPEVILVLLFISGYIGHKLHNPRAKRVVRWGTLIAGMVTIG